MANLVLEEIQDQLVQQEAQDNLADQDLKDSLDLLVIKAQLEQSDQLDLQDQLGHLDP